MKNIILKEIEESISTKQLVFQSEGLVELLEKLATQCISALKAGGKVIFCGNGGSFGDAQHLAAELVARLRFDRPPLASIALGTNSSNVTAIGNDFGYEFVFAREMGAIGKQNDVFIAISTSGNSKNVIEAIHIAKQIGMQIFAFTGETGGKMNDMCTCLKVPSPITDKVQESHIMFGHIICHLIESTMFTKS